MGVTLWNLVGLTQGYLQSEDESEEDMNSPLGWPSRFMVVTVKGARHHSVFRHAGQVVTKVRDQERVEAGHKGCSHRPPSLPWEWLHHRGAAARGVYSDPKHGF